MSAGSEHTCGVRTSGAARLPGRATTSTGQSRSRATFAGAAVDAGGDSTCGVGHVGTLACWGSNGYGQASPPGGTFTAVSAGGEHAAG